MEIRGTLAVQIHGIDLWYMNRLMVQNRCTLRGYRTMVQTFWYRTMLQINGTDQWCRAVAQPEHNPLVQTFGTCTNQWCRPRVKNSGADPGYRTVVQTQGIEPWGRLRLQNSGADPGYRTVVQTQGTGRWCRPRVQNSGADPGYRTLVQTQGT